MGRGAVAADGIDRTAQRRVAQHVPAGDGAEQRDDRAHRHAEKLPAADPEQAVGKLPAGIEGGNRHAVGDEQHGRRGVAGVLVVLSDPADLGVGSEAEAEH